MPADYRRYLGIQQTNSKPFAAPSAMASVRSGAELSQVFLVRVVESIRAV